MGIYDRDYYRNPSPQRFGAFAGWTVTNWLIAVNIAVFVLERLTQHWTRWGLYDPICAWGNFNVPQALHQCQLWRFVTFQFLHANIPHLFGNMLGLYFFGRMIEEMLGPRRYLAFYLACGAAGPLCFTVIWQFQSQYPRMIQPSMIGASAGVFGVLVAAARTAPNATVTLLFPPIPMRLRTLAWVMVGVAAFVVLTSSNQPGETNNNWGGEAAHLGGAGLGFLLIGHPHWLNFADRIPFLGRRRYPRASRKSGRFWSP